MTLALLPPMKEKMPVRANMNVQAMGEDECQQQFDSFCRSSHARLQRSNSQRSTLLNKKLPTLFSLGKKAPHQDETMRWSVHDSNSAQRTPINSRRHEKYLPESLRDAKLSPPSANSSPTGSEPDTFLNILLSTHRNNAPLTECIDENVLDSPSLVVGGGMALPQRALLRAPSLADVMLPPPPPPDDDDDDEENDGSDDESDDNALSFAGESQGESDDEWSDVDDDNNVMKDVEVVPEASTNKEEEKTEKTVTDTAVVGWTEPPHLSRAVTADARMEETVSPLARKSITKRLFQKVGNIGKHAGALAWGASAHGRIESANSAKKSPRFSRKLCNTFEEMDCSSSEDDDQGPLIKNREIDLDAPHTPSHVDMMLMNHEIFIEEMPLATGGRSSSFGKLQPCLSPASSIGSHYSPSPKSTTPLVSDRLMRRIEMHDDRSPDGRMRMQSYHGGMSPSVSSRHSKKWPTDDFKGGMSSHAKLPSQPGSNHSKNRSSMRSKSPPPTRSNLAKVGATREIPLSFESGSSHARLQSYFNNGSNRSNQSAPFPGRQVQVVSASVAARDEPSLSSSMSFRTKLQEVGGSFRSLENCFVVRSAAPTSPFMVQRLKATQNEGAPMASNHGRLHSQNNGSNRSRTLSSRSAKEFDNEQGHQGETAKSDSIRSKSSHGGRSDHRTNDRLRLRARDEFSAAALGNSSHARLQSVMPASRQQLSTSRHSVSDHRSFRSDVDRLSSSYAQPSISSAPSESRQLSNSRHSVHSKHSFRSASDRMVSNSAHRANLSPKIGGSLHNRQKMSKTASSGDQKKAHKDKKLKDASSIVSADVDEDVAAAIEMELLDYLRSNRHKQSTTHQNDFSSAGDFDIFPTETTLPLSGSKEYNERPSQQPAETHDFDKSDSDMSYAEGIKKANEEMYLQLCLPSLNDSGQVIEPSSLPQAKDDSDLFVQFCWSSNVQGSNKLAKDRKKFLESYKRSQLPMEQRMLNDEGGKVILGGGSN